MFAHKCWKFGPFLRRHIIEPHFKPRLVLLSLVEKIWDMAREVCDLQNDILARCDLVLDIIICQSRSAIHTKLWSNSRWSNIALLLAHLQLEVDKIFPLSSCPMFEYPYAEWMPLVSQSPQQGFIAKWLLCGWLLTANGWLFGNNDWMESNPQFWFFIWFSIEQAHEMVVVVFAIHVNDSLSVFLAYGTDAASGERRPHHWLWRDCSG